MKYITIFFGAFFFSVNVCFPQIMNWQTNPDQQHSLIYLNIGYDYGLTTQIGYGYKLNTLKQILLKTDLSIPMGNQLLDDFKFSIGGQIAVLEKNNFHVSASCDFIVRKQQTSIVRQIGIGSEVAIVTGFYKKNWHIAVEFGFDKSITTHLKHSEYMQSNYSEIQDAWFWNTGGQLFYGLQGSKTIGKRINLNLRIGATNAQGNDVDALLPYYGQLGIIYKLYN